MWSPVPACGVLQIASLLLASALGGMVATAALAHPGPAADASNTTGAAVAANWGPHWHSGRGQYYKRSWGVDIVGVKPVASGYMLAFRYRILDPDKAGILNDRKSRAYLIDEATGTVLMVPTMENVGELRPGADPEADRTYFIIFGNPGKLVKSGGRVSIVAGALRIEGLIVE